MTLPRPAVVPPVLLLGLLMGLLTACGSAKAPAADQHTTAAGTCRYVDNGQTAARKVHLPPANPDPKAPTRVTIRTNVGDIPVTLEPDTAPCAVNAFLSLAEQGFYNKTICHRLTTYRIYVLQCGDPTATGDPNTDGTGTPGYSFASEVVPNDPRTEPCRHVQSTGGPVKVCLFGAGVVALANSGPDTNGSQFFLVYNRSAIPPAYPILGHMDAAGLKVVKQVAQGGVAKPGPNGPTDGTPRTTVTISAVSIKEPANP